MFLSNYWKHYISIVPTPHRPLIHSRCKRASNSFDLRLYNVIIMSNSTGVDTQSVINFFLSWTWFFFVIWTYPNLCISLCRLWRTQILYRWFPAYALVSLTISSCFVFLPLSMTFPSTSLSPSRPPSPTTLLNTTRFRDPPVLVSATQQIHTQIH